jgi:hypothetical protein
VFLLLYTEIFEILKNSLLLAHVVLACAVVESSSRKTRKITSYHILAFDFYIEFAWLGTLEDDAHHLQTLIEPSTTGNKR